MSTSCSSSRASNQADLGLIPIGGISVEEAADHQVGFPCAAVPGAEAEALEAGVAVHDLHAGSAALGNPGGCFAIYVRRDTAGMKQALSLPPPRLTNRPCGPTFSIPLFAEVEVLKGIGPGLAKPLKRLGLERVVDVLFHLPTGWIDRKTDRHPRHGRCRAGGERGGDAG